MSVDREVKALLLTAALLAVGIGVALIPGVLPQARTSATLQGTADATRSTVATAASQQQWRRAWTCPAGGGLAGVPAAWSNGWIAATEKGRILALDNSGRLLWSQSFSNLSVVGSPVVLDAALAVLDGDGSVTALQAATGGLLWQVSVAGSYRHGPLALRQGDSWQVVVLSAADGVLHALDAKDGRTLWQSEPTNRSDGPPGTDGRLIAYGNCDSAVHVFSATNGAQLAQVPVGADAQMAGGVLVCGRRVIGGTRGGELVCVDVVSNRVAWSVPVANGEAFNTPVAVDGRILMSSHDGRIYSVAALDGAPQWQVSLSNVVKSLCVVDDAVFAVAGGSLVGLRVKDGREFLKMPVGDDVEGPVWNGSLLVVAADGGNVIGFRGE